MLKRLRVKNFTVSYEADFEFAPGINVIIGENGLGKSHILKLGYACGWLSHSVSKNPKETETKQDLQKRIAEKLVRVFRPDSLGRLAKRGQGRSKAQVYVTFQQKNTSPLDFSFATNSKSEVTLRKHPPTRGVTEPVIFLPTKEVISMYPGFASLYRDYHMEIDETYFDLCLALERPLLRGPRYDKIQTILQPLEELLGGKVSNENGRFLLRQPGAGNMEMPLVAEGIRKLASVTYLLANGSLMNNATLYWDEPETNLNPRLISKLAQMLVSLAQQGTQIILATHSLFLVKELDLQLKTARRKANVPARFFALSAGAIGVMVQAGDSAEDVEPIAALDAEIEQAERSQTMLWEEEATQHASN
jgi:energy-coupling factor transporter ATP-binding protein EcfA2